MVSFGFNTLFTNVPIEKTVDIKLKTICQEKENNINITKETHEKFAFILYQKYTFTFNGNI